ncbi:MAG TPA: hypothetical protein VF519_00255 [Mycobacteriales bacterium]|jgi:hypothetical protein
MTTITRAGLAAAVVAVVVGGAGGADACQPEYCPPRPLLCDVGPFAGTCIDPY